MGELIQDLRYAGRQLIKNPGFAAVTILTLALGIGANTAIFSVVRSVLLRPLPYRNGERIVHIGYRPAEGGVKSASFSVLEVGDYQRQMRTVRNVMEYHSMAFSLIGQGDPDEVQTGVVSANFFPGLGIEPLYGRLFRPEEDRLGADAVLLLAYGYWQQRFGGDPRVVGRGLQMNGRVITIVGILPPLPQFPGKDDIFIPLAACPFRMSDHMVHGRTMRMMDLFGELKPGVGPQQVRSEVSTIAHRLRAAYPEPKTASAVPAVLPVVPVKDELTSQFRPTLLVLLGTVGLVLLLACANVANLTLARLMSREREVVVRSAIGAGRSRLVRQLLTESTLLALLGGALGLLLSFAGLRLLVAFAALFTPRSSEVRIDGGVLLFTFVVSGLTGLLFGCVPALQATNRDISTALKEASGRTTGGAGGHGFRSLLIVLQVAISFVLLLGAGLMLRSLVALQQVDLGFKPQNVLAVRITLPFSRYTKQAQFRAFFDQLVQRAAAQPGVLAVGLANDRPLSGGLINRDFQIEGRTAPADQEQPKAAFHIVSPDYFHVLGVPLLRGRLLTPADNSSGLQVALINDSMARQYWPGQDPVGKRIQMTDGRSGWRTIVGVVRDLRQRGLEDAPGPAFFYPFAQAPVNRAQLFIRTTARPLSMVGALQAIVRGLDPQQPVSNVQTLEQALADSLAPSRLTTALLGLCAALAFLITGAGVSGVLAVFVSERTQEIGVRSALGASRGEVLGLVLRQSMTLMLVGLVLGALGAAALTRLLAGLLYGVKPNDPLTFVVVAGFLLLVVAAACLIPARRALAIDPVVALRT